MAVTAVSYVFRDGGDLWKVARSLEEVESLNFGRDGFRANFICQELVNERGAAVLLLDDGKVVGYTSAMDAKEAYQMSSHYFGRNFDNTAYISNSSIHPDYQHKGYIWMMMEKLEEILSKKGYLFLDRDSRSNLGYADKVIAHYGGRVVFAYPPEETMWGNQQYIRVRL